MRNKFSAFGFSPTSSTGERSDLIKGKGEFYMDRTKSGDTVSADFPASTTAPLVASRPFDLKLIVDRCAIEAYAQNGTIAMSNLVFPPSQNNKIAFFTSTGKPVSITGKIWQLCSIWK